MRIRVENKPAGFSEIHPVFICEDIEDVLGLWDKLEDVPEINLGYQADTGDCYHSKTAKITHLQDAQTGLKMELYQTSHLKHLIRVRTDVMKLIRARMEELKMPQQELVLKVETYDPAKPDKPELTGSAKFGLQPGLSHAGHGLYAIGKHCLVCNMAHGYHLGWACSDGTP